MLYIFGLRSDCSHYNARRIVLFVGLLMALAVELFIHESYYAKQALPSFFMQWTTVIGTFILILGGVSNEVTERLVCRYWKRTRKGDSCIMYFVHCFLLFAGLYQLFFATWVRLASNDGAVSGVMSYAIMLQNLCGTPMVTLTVISLTTMIEIKCVKPIKADVADLDCKAVYQSFSHVKTITEELSNVIQLYLSMLLATFLVFATDTALKALRDPFGYTMAGTAFVEFPNICVFLVIGICTILCFSVVAYPSVKLDSATLALQDTVVHTENVCADDILASIFLHNDQTALRVMGIEWTQKTLTLVTRIFYLFVGLALTRT